ncbi:glycosyltransferase family 4 protein [Methylobacterium hispanicum]|uniref:glycosyltransferase family 4 protein n=2 Tax=Methylobacterium TaxID=407 RepID=UPI002F35BED0
MSPSMRDAADDTRPPDTPHPDTRPPDTRHPGAPAAGRAERFRGAPAPRPHVLLIQPQAENAGAQAIARMLATALAERGYRTGQLFFYRKTGAFDAEPGVAFCAAGRPRTPLAFARFFLDLVRRIRRARPDAVLCFQHYGNIVGAAAARLAGVPVVIANQNSARDTTPPRARAVDRWLGARGLYGRIVVNSHDSAGDLADYPERYRARVVHIDHGFVGRDSALSQAEARARLGLALPPGGRLLGCVARLHPLKNLAAAVRLLPHDPARHLALAGQGAERDALAGLAEELGCGARLHLVGELPPERVGDFLRALDVFVFPSRAETFGLAAVEAAQAGVPVVANALPVLREVLATRDGPCALFADAEDDAALAQAVRRLERDPELAARLVRSGRGLAGRFPVDAMAEAYDALLRERIAAARRV